MPPFFVRPLGMTRTRTLRVVIFSKLEIGYGFLDPML
jgi:hypothetical protein